MLTQKLIDDLKWERGNLLAYPSGYVSKIIDLIDEIIQAWEGETQFTDFTPRETMIEEWDSATGGRYLYDPPRYPIYYDSNPIPVPPIDTREE